MANNATIVRHVHVYDCATVTVIRNRTGTMYRKNYCATMAATTAALVVVVVAAALSAV